MSALDEMTSGMIDAGAAVEAAGRPGLASVTEADDVLLDLPPTPEPPRGFVRLWLKRAEVERSLRAEETRLRHIESRIAQIDRHGGTQGFDVIVKSVEPTPLLSLHCACADQDEVADVFQHGQRLIDRVG